MANRRGFIKRMAVGGVALAGGADRLLGTSLHGGMQATLSGASPAALRPPAAAGAAWADRMGLELYTVRDLIGKDYIGTLEKVAQIGFKEVEPAEEYANLSPRAFRAQLDRLGLTMPSTHSGIAEGPEMEQRLASFQVMGIQYTSLDDPRPAGAANRPRVAPPARPPAPVSRAEQRRQLQEYIRRASQPRTTEDVKQEAARYNRVGKVAAKYDIKLLRHNHTVEFIRCSDADTLPYTIMLAEMDPELVAFQLDIGWACVAGQDPVQLFQQHPGRFPLWHVKDAAGLKCLPPASDEAGRMAEARLVPVGLGDVDYGEIFKHADLAGLKHFAIEQDSAADWGDSIAATRVSYQNLRATLTQKVS